MPLKVKSLSIGELRYIADIVTFGGDPASSASVIAYTYLSTIEAGFRDRRFSFEIMYGNSIYENQIETFSIF